MPVLNTGSDKSVVTLTASLRIKKAASRGLMPAFTGSLSGQRAVDRIPADNPDLQVFQTRTP